MLPTDKFNKNAFRAIREKLKVDNEWHIRDDCAIGELYFDEKKTEKGVESFEIKGKAPGLSQKSW